MKKKKKDVIRVGNQKYSSEKITGMRILNGKLQIRYKFSPSYEFAVKPSNYRIKRE